MRTWHAGFAALFICSTVPMAGANDPAQITSGPARFTVITPNLIRLEYSPGGKFTDEPTLFASNRSARSKDAKITRQDSLIVIQTDAMKLDYQNNGRPFALGSLEIYVRRSHGAILQRIIRWDPNVIDTQNLGGTLRTLDRCTGPKDLGMGILSRSGWALVDDSGTPILTNGWVRSRPNQGEFDWYFFGYGSDFKAALKSLAAISGPVPLPRKNLLGIWYSRYWPYTAQDFRQIVQEYSDHAFPLDNIVMDMDWHITQAPGVKRAHAGQIWTGYTWDQNLIPDPRELLQWFHQQGLQVTLNDHPADGVQAHEEMYASFMRAMGQDSQSGKVLPFDAGDEKYLDTFWQFTHEPRQRDGVDFWWLDWQQFPFTKSVPDLQNLPWLNRFYFLKSESAGKRGVSFSRWGGWGDQKYPIHFSGDANTGWPMLAFEVPFTSTAGNVGCFFWTHDIGGHMGGRNEESYTRWCQFGALSAALRSHSTRDATMDRRPWKYPQWAEDSMRQSFQLRAELMPYIYSSAAESCRETEPLLRPMYFEFPDQEPAYHNAQEYLFGDDLLVAPITTPGVGPTHMAWQKVWFPQGTDTWYDYFTGEKHDAGTTAVVAAGIDQFPLFVRGGAPIPLQPYTPRPTSAPLNHLVIRCFPGADGEAQSSQLYEDDGQTTDYETGAFAQTKLTCRYSGNTISLQISPTLGKFTGQETQRQYTTEFADVQRPQSALVDGAPAEFSYDPETSTARVEVPARAIDQSLTVNLIADPADPDAVHRQAVAQRLSQITGAKVEPGEIQPMVASALDATRDPALRAAVLAAGGVTVFHTNDAPYLYGGKDSMTVIAAPDILDSPNASASVECGATQTPSISVQISDGATLDINSLCAQLPPEDSILVPGRNADLQMTINVAHKKWDISVPAFLAMRAGIDLARSASATATSCEDGYSPSGAIDRVADGYPHDRQHEWSSNHEKAGTALTLTWDSIQTVSRVSLFDRPNLNDQILAGSVVFSDGSTVPFGALPNDGTIPVNLSFSPRKIRWLRIEITQVSPTTENTGLAEVGVFR